LSGDFARIALQLGHSGGFQALFGLVDFVFDTVTLFEGLETIAANAGKMNKDIRSSTFLKPNPFLLSNHLMTPLAILNSPQ